jgi:SNF2 family DNA or RNA helicase
MLYPHQQEAIKWIKGTEEQPRLHEQQPRGGILAHEMGLGKTITMLTYMSTHGGLNLVICPKSVLTNWLHEATSKGFYAKDHIFVYYGLNRKSVTLEAHVQLVLTTFDIVRTESAFKKTSLLYNTTWMRIVLDEAHRIAERNSKTSKSISQLKGYNRWCLTGTPYKNGLSDIVALCKFLKIQPYSKATWWKHNAHNECSLKQWRALHLHIRHKNASFLTNKHPL